MAEQSIKLPGYYITTTVRTEDWPYRDPPLQTNPDEEIKYWGGHKWLRGAPRRRRRGTISDEHPICSTN